MNLKQYLNYYNNINNLKDLTNKKINSKSVSLTYKDIIVLFTNNDNTFKIIKINGLDYKYMILNNNNGIYTIKKQLYNCYNDFKINKLSVFKLDYNFNI